MSEAAKVLYIVVIDEDEKGEGSRESFSYTRAVLQSVLQLMGCKARHAFKISQRVFKLRRNDYSSIYLPFDGIKIPGLGSLIEEENYGHTAFGKRKTEVCDDFSKMNHEKRNIPPFELYKRRTTVVIRRETFLKIVCDALAEYKYVGPNQKRDLILACRIRERKESVTVLLCGTSGCGKSTLSSLLASRLGITTVISTDSIRHMMRSFVDAKKSPLLWASTYHAGEFLDHVAVSEAKAKRKANKQKVVLQSHSRGGSDDLAIRSDIRSDIRPLEQASTCSELVSSKQMAIEGFKAQSEMVIDSLDRLITAWEERKESVVVEGVHLSLNFVMGLMKKHPSIIPFMIYISSEDKHLERFAVRAKYMTLDPAKNKYVKYIQNIRTIQDYLCKRADKHLVPKINNTNVDKSVASIHATVFSCLRRRQAGEQLYEFNRNTVTMVDEEYRNQCVANSFSSKGMFQLIQRKGSSRNLMAIVNTDGSVAKAWPVDSVNRKENLFQGQTDYGIGIPMYGPLEVGKAESVNLQFGLYGVSAWTNVGGTSLAGSIDESKGEATDTGSRYLSSCCSSPRNSDGPSKELMEDNSVLGSDEEIDDPPEQGSEEDFSVDGDKHIHEEIGSVDEESTRSDDEYDDLAMLDVREKWCWSNEDEELKEKLVLSRYSSTLKDSEEYHHQNPSQFIRTRSELSEPLCSYSSLLRKTKGRSSLTPGNVKMRKRSLSIPSLGKHGSSSVGEPILSGAPRG